MHETARYRVAANRFENDYRLADGANFADLRSVACMASSVFLRSWITILRIVLQSIPPFRYRTKRL
jgi:hypothetical protein